MPASSMVGYYMVFVTYCWLVLRTVLMVDSITFGQEMVNILVSGKEWKEFMVGAKSPRSVLEVEKGEDPEEDPKKVPEKEE
ncbi:hypothetical protein Tco_0885338 [Tanacetum coccineum]